MLPHSWMGWLCVWVSVSQNMARLSRRSGPRRAAARRWAAARRGRSRGQRVKRARRVLPGGFLSTAGVLLAPNFTRAFAMAVGNAKKRGSRRPDTCLATPTLAHTTRGPPTHPQQLRGSMSGRPPSADLICGASGGRCVAKRLLHRRQEDHVVHDSLPRDHITAAHKRRRGPRRMREGGHLQRWGAPTLG